MVTGAGQALCFGYTLYRPARVEYQLVSFRAGQWRFDAAKVLYDEENSGGLLRPGRK